MFTSRRERRLWLWALIVAAAIFSTLGIAPSLAEALRDRGLLDAAFALGLLLVGASIVMFAAGARPSGLEVGIVLGVAAVGLLLVARAALTAEERTHLIEYGVLAVLIHEALAERTRHGRGVRSPALAAVLMTALIGLLDESIQAFLPSRVFDWRDLAFNAAAGAVAVGTSVILSRAMKWRESHFG